MNNKLNEILSNLDMSKENGLANDECITEMSSYQKLNYTQLKSKLGIEAIYFLRDSEGIAKIPLIYFSMIDDGNSKKAAQLHRLSWNVGEAPLLFVVTPTELKIYNNYQIPQKANGELDPEAGLIKTINLLTDLETQRKELAEYNRILFESGEYWLRCKKRFDISTRVDTTLMNNLRVMRKRLISRLIPKSDELGLKHENVVSIVHGLLSRSILIQYLEERKDSNGESVFPKNFYKQFDYMGVNYQKYTDVLNSKKATYELFSVLEKKFNGDMFPLVQNEFNIVSDCDLQELRSFLLGDSNLENQQLTLWPLYDFNIIPIRMISSIYELFFHLSDNDDEKGTYYTPLHLVETILDEVYPWEGDYLPIKVVDPSCGSGIFLVEAYRRIVCRWMHSNNTVKISNAQLTDILQKSIFGIDLNEEAVRIASFSLSLALCDFLDPRSIWNDLNFPKLVNTNLLISDFFDNKLDYLSGKYDIIIGNPPWQSQLTDLTSEYLKKNKRVVGDKQIAQAFLIKCSELCNDNGIIGLLMPSKGFLFNRSKQSTIFRKNFFSENTILVIINFSIYRKFLFDNASAPCTAVIYFPSKKQNENSIFYCTPKPQYSIQDHNKFSIDPTDVCRIPNDMTHDDRIWKIAMWGTPRDLDLIDRIQSTFPSLNEFLNMNRKMYSVKGDFKHPNTEWRWLICGEWTQHREKKEAILRK